MTADELPEGWALATFGEIASKVGSGSTPRGGSLAYASTGIPLIRSMNVHFDGFSPGGLAYLNDKQADLLREVTVQADDVLLNITGASIGRVCKVPRDLAGSRVNQHVCIIRLKEQAIPTYISKYLSSPAVQEKIWGEEYGVTRQALTKGQILAFELPLPPLAEQRRIVAAVERILGKVSAARARLERVPTTLKRFRQAVLAAACSGGMTDALPPNWRAVTLFDVIEGLKYGTSKKSEYEKKGVSILRIPNVSGGQISHDDMKYSELEPAEYEQLRLRVGDVLMIRSNGSVSLLGKTALVAQAEADFAYAGYLIRIRPNPTLILPTYLNAVLASEAIRNQIEMPARSTSGVNNINSEEVRALEFALPPLAEQQKIVRRVSALFARADAIEVRAAAALKRVESLAQAVLAKAFRGELVPTEAELARRENRLYESAGELLERIRASATAPAKPSRTPKPKAK